MEQISLNKQNIKTIKNQKTYPRVNNEEELKDPQDDLHLDFKSIAESLGANRKKKLSRRSNSPSDERILKSDEISCEHKKN